MSRQGPAAPVHILSEEDRSALSDRRIKLAFLLFTVGLLIAISGLIFAIVTAIFDRLTPSLEHDLAWKARRGVVSLGHEIDLALLTEDIPLIEASTRDYRADGDVRAIVAANAQGEVLYRYGQPAHGADLLFQEPARMLREQKGELMVWDEIVIEGVRVGRVALVISTARVSAGDRLRRDILAVAALGCVLALLACLMFVNLYVAPVLRITHATIARLEQMTVQALEATRLKSEFLANMSHEIRTPMNGVLAMTDLLMRTSLDVRQLRFAEIIRASARSLLTIVNDVLDFSKIEAGKYELSPTDFDPRSTVRDAVELLAPRAHAKGLEFSYRVDEAVPALVHADVDRFRQVLVNLLGNAVKFTDHGAVTLSVQSELSAGRLRCEISDTGPGISEQGRAKLFQSFTQVDGSSTRKYGGTGLGLAISQRLVSLMGGQIGVESRLGEGSRFWFTISVRVVSDVASEPTPSFAGSRVLVVSDQRATAELLAHMLTRFQVEHDRSASVLDALEQIERADMAERPYDAVVVEAKTEGGRGAGLARSVASSTMGALVLLVVDGVSGETLGDRATVERLIKPVRESDLLDFLQRAHARRQEASRADGEQTESRGHVLIVEDNEINQTVALELLAQLGYTSEIASHGAEGVDAFRRGCFDAILMDCQMPVMDGYLASRTIRELERSEGRARIPILAVTAHAIAGERDKVLSAGMDDYLTKPIARELIERTLARHLVRAGRERARGQAAPAAPSLPSAALPREPTRASQMPDERSLLDPLRQRSLKVLELFLGLVPKQIEELREAARQKHLESARAAAHKLKGGSASVGASAIAELCEALQHAAERGDLETLREGATRLESLFEATAILARRELAQARLHNGAAPSS